MYGDAMHAGSTPSGFHRADSETALAVLAGQQRNEAKSAAFFSGLAK